MGQQKEENESKQGPERIKINIDESGKDLGQVLTRHKMFDQPTIQKWGIFY